ncbi:MAG: L-threonylcarbamoyladenylate synthase [Bacteroidota bacterium]
MQTIVSGDIEQAGAILREGGLVAIPTETVYGLAANAESAEAVVQIFDVKQRPAFDPLIVHIGGSSELTRFAHSIPDAAFQLAEAFWPGPLTLVLPRRDCIPDIVTSGLDTVGLRVPAHPIALELLRSLDFPLAAPSANPFGYISPTCPQHVLDQLGGKIPYILDGGACTVGVESTIVGFEDGQVCVYRLGGVSIEKLQEVIPGLKLQISQSSDPKAPGMLESHYAPRKPLVLTTLAETLPLREEDRAAVLSFDTNWSSARGVVCAEVLSPSADIQEAATNLFAALRRLDASPAERIYAELVPEIGVGRAVNDRLRRASSGGEI